MRLATGASDDHGQGEQWDAQAEHDIGVFILSYLDRHPAPAGSRIHPDLACAGRDLRAAGQMRLARLGMRRLRVADTREE